jgi:hypothetical protein
MAAENRFSDRPLLIVDGANVVGSVPDGWWRDRAGAAERLRDSLRTVASSGLAAAEGVPVWATGAPLHVVLVVEGAARGVRSIPGVLVKAAAGSGDDEIVDLVRAAGVPRTVRAGSADAASGGDGGAAGDRRCLVVTADRQLRDRVRALGASVVGPRAIRPALT